MAKANKLPFDLFTTDGHAAHDRFEAWHDRSSVIFDVAPAADGPRPRDFRATLASYHLGNLIVMRADFDAQRFERTRRKIAAESLDLYQVQLYAAGGLAGSAGDSSRILRPGDVQILDLARPNHTQAQRSETIACFVPHEVMHAALPAVDLHGLVLRGDNARGGLLADYLRALIGRMPEMTTEDAPLLARATVGLIAAGVQPTAETTARAMPQIDAVTRDRVRRYIDRYLTDSRLGPDALCAAFQVSRTTLYRLFAAEGGVLKCIQDRRLAAALRDLTKPASERPRIIDVALDWGFASEAHFSRLFRAAYGMSPSDARRFKESPSVSAMREGDRYGQSDVADWLRRLHSA